MRKLIRNAVFAAMIGVCCYQIGRIAKYNEIRERANISHEFGEGYFTAFDVEEIIEGYED